MEDKNIDVKREYIIKPSLLEVCSLYSFSVIVLIILGYRVQRNGFYLGSLITEYVLILLPPIAFLIFFKYDLKKVLRINPVRIKSLLIVFCIMVLSIPIVNMLNYFYLVIVKSVFGKILLPQIPIAYDTKSLIVNVFVVGVSAGICEEILFRGVIQRGFEKFGVAMSILIPAFLFGLWHMDFQKLLGTFLLGSIIGFIVYKTDSIFAGMFAHFTNNALGVTLEYLFSKVPSKGSEGGDDIASISTFLNMSMDQLATKAIVWLTILVLLGMVLNALFKALNKSVSANNRSIVIVKEASTKEKIGMIGILPGLSIIGLLYYIQGVRMMGGIVNLNIIKILSYLGVI